MPGEEMRDTVPYTPDPSLGARWRATKARLLSAA